MTADDIRRSALDIQTLSTLMRQVGSRRNVIMNGEPVANISPDWLTSTSDWLGELAMDLSKHALELANEQGIIILEKE